MTPLRLAPPALLALVALAFWPILGNGFVNWDDQATIVQNPHLKHFGLDFILWSLRTSHYGHFQPLAWLSYAAEHLFFGLNPSGYHAVSLIQHSVAVLLFFRLILFLLGERKDSVVAAGIAAALWAVHPQRVEAVAWATERREMLSTIFLLLSANLYVRAVKDNEDHPSLGASLISFVLAGLSKVTVFTFPVLLLVLDMSVLRRRQPLRALLAEKRAFILVAAVVLALGLRAQSLASSSLDLARYGALRRLQDVLFSPGYYLLTCLWPLELSPLVIADPVLAPLHFAVPATATILVVIALWIGARRAPGARAFAAAFGVLMIPVAGFFRSGPQTAADRFFGWPALVVSVAVAFFLAGKSRRVLAVVSVAVLALIPVTRGQCRVWQDSVSLWTRALAVGPSNPLSWRNAIAAHAEAGDAEGAAELRAGFERLYPDEPVLLVLKGDSAYKAGRYEDAAQLYGRAAAEDPWLQDALVNQGATLGRLGRYAEALPPLAEAVTRFPGQSRAWHNLGLVLAGLGRPQDAERALLQALELDPQRRDSAAALDRLRASGPK